MNLSVVVPSHRRPLDLLNCLQALAAQAVAPMEVLIVVRLTDTATRDALASADIPSSLPWRIVEVTEGGVVAALNAGLKAAAGEIICFTDDDAMPHPDWLLKISTFFEQHHEIDGVGGKDWVHVRGKPITETRDIVGLIEPSGRITGDHHLGHGTARQVDVLKGVNMSFRANAIKPIGFDTRLKGTGAQVHNELALCLSLRKSGKRLVYDPSIQVDHFPGERFDEDARSGPSKLAISNASYNETLTLMDYFGPKDRRRVYNWYSFIGTRASPGLLQVFRLLLKGDDNVINRWQATRTGRIDAWRDAHMRTDDSSTPALGGVMFASNHINAHPQEDRSRNS